LMLIIFPAEGMGGLPDEKIAAIEACWVHWGPTEVVPRTPFYEGGPKCSPSRRPRCRNGMRDTTSIVALGGVNGPGDRNSCRKVR
jgi:hypothetical protein